MITILKVIMESQVTYGGLFLFSFWYILKTSREREQSLQNLLDKFDKTLDNYIDALRDLNGKIERIEEKLEVISKNGLE